MGAAAGYYCYEQLNLHGKRTTLVVTGYRATIYGGRSLFHLRNLSSSPEPSEYIMERSKLMHDVAL